MKILNKINNKIIKYLITNNEIDNNLLDIEYNDFIKNNTIELINDFNDLDDLNDY